jgi:hypothetical protein
MPIKIKDGKLETVSAFADDGHMLEAAEKKKFEEQKGSHVVVQPTAQIVHQHTTDKGKTIVSENIEHEVGAPVEVQIPYAEVTYDAGRVFTDGNFGSFRVGISLKWPCAAQFHAIEEAYEFARNYVNTKLVEELKGTPVEIKEDGQ